MLHNGRLVGVVSQRDLMELLSVKLELVDNDASPMRRPLSGMGGSV